MIKYMVDGVVFNNKELSEKFNNANRKVIKVQVPLYMNVYEDMNSIFDALNDDKVTTNISYNVVCKRKDNNEICVFHNCWVRKKDNRWVIEPFREGGVLQFDDKDSYCYKVQDKQVPVQLIGFSDIIIS